MSRAVLLPPDMLSWQCIGSDAFQQPTSERGALAASQGYVGERYDW
jgi:hypothetical protein